MTINISVLQNQYLNTIRNTVKPRYSEHGLWWTPGYNEREV